MARPTRRAKEHDDSSPDYSVKMTAPQSRTDGALHRAPRPLMGWAGVVLLVICVVFAGAVMAAIALGFWLTAARGLGVPDMTGGLAALIAALVPAWGLVGQYLSTRSRERRDEIAYGGGRAEPPFDPSPPSPPVYPDTWPNPHGGPGAP